MRMVFFAQLMKGDGLLNRLGQMWDSTDGKVVLLPL